MSQELLGGMDFGQEVPGTPQIQSVQIKAGGGSFKLTFDSTPGGGNPQTTGAIPYNVDAAGLKSALEALSNITTVTVTGTNPLLYVQMQDSVLNYDAMTADVTDLVGIDEWVFQNDFLAAITSITGDSGGAQTGPGITLTAQNEDVSPTVVGFGNVLTIQAANATTTGLITTGDQFIGGVKTFVAGEIDFNFAGVGTSSATLSLSNSTFGLLADFVPGGGVGGVVLAEIVWTELFPAPNIVEFRLSNLAGSPSPDLKPVYSVSYFDGATNTFLGLWGTGGGGDTFSGGICTALGAATGSGNTVHANAPTMTDVIINASGNAATPLTLNAFSGSQTAPLLDADGSGITGNGYFYSEKTTAPTMNGAASIQGPYLS